MNHAVFYATSQPAANATNEAGGKAYAMDDRHALAQLCLTGCFNDTYYATAQDQTDKILTLAKKVPVDFLAKLAVYARAEGKMKDAPAVLLAVLLGRDTALFKKAFWRVVDNPKMLRNFVQVIRSGVTGRKSLGTVAKRAVQEYLRSERFYTPVKREVAGSNPVRVLRDPVAQLVERLTNRSFLSPVFCSDWRGVVGHVSQM